MFSAILKFELKYFFRNISIYVYIPVFFLSSMIAMAGAAGIFGEGSSSGSIANSPLGIYTLAMFFSKLLLILVPAICGMAIYRDHVSNFSGLLYTYPFSEWEYLSAKFVSSFTVVMFIVMFTVAGLVAGTYLPGVDASQITANDPVVYMHVFVIYLFPNILFFSIIVFSAVALTRNIYAGFIVLVLSVIIAEVISRVSGAYGINMLGLLADPFAEKATGTLAQVLTRSQRDNMPIPIDDVIIFNRLLWLLLGTIVCIVTIRNFSFRGRELSLRRNRKNSAKNPVNTNEDKQRLTIPLSAGRQDLISQLKTALMISGAEFSSIFRSGLFISVLIAGSILVGVLTLMPSPQTSTTLLPATRVVLGLPVFFYSKIIMVITFLYAGILIHRPESSRFAELINVTPASDSVLMLSKLFALIRVQLTLLTSVMLTGIFIQLISGYYDFEIGHYLFDLFVIHLPWLIVWAMASLLVQSLFSNQYAGFFFLAAAYLGISNLSSLGIESSVLKFNHSPDPDFYLRYSDMSGYGHGLESYFVYMSYWLMLGLVFLCISILFTRRELSQSFLERARIALSKFRGKLAVLTIISSAFFFSTGAFLVYEENKPENLRLSAKEERQLLKEFQKNNRHYKNAVQPRIASVFVNMNIFPDERSFNADGHYVLINKSTRRIDTLLVKAGYDEITTVALSRDAKIISEDPAFRFRAYLLKNALEPGDSMKLSFSVANKPNTFLVQYSNVLKDGTYLKSDIFPRLGYFADKEKTFPGDSTLSGNHYQSIDSDLIDLETIVSTSPEQSAIAPGFLISERTDSSRRYFHYKIGSKTKFVFGYNSGKFDLLQEEYKGVILRVYYNKKHFRSVGNLISGLKASLDYNSQYFGDLPHQQAQIIEFSLSEGTYATTAANCIPVSEARFLSVANNSTDNDVNISFYVAAHELAHQWWGNIVIPADAPGATMITESVAEYLTAKIYEKQFGKKSVRRFLDIQLNRYFSGRSEETNMENPLIHVQPEQTYISYGKGAIALYTLSQYIGEEKLNGALREYLIYASRPGQPYTTSKDLIQYLRQATPDSLQYVITDLFETTDSEKMTAHFRENLPAEM